MPRACAIGLLAALALASLAWPGDGLAQSFDCAKAATESERAICDSPALAAWDAELADVYAAVLAKRSGTEESALRQTQRAWIAARDSCDADRDCLAERYRKRLTALTKMGGLFPGWIGRYARPDANLDIRIRPGDESNLFVRLQGAGDSGNWTCAIGGEGTPDGSGQLRVQDDGLSPVILEAVGDGLYLPPGPAADALDDYGCGVRAPHISGLYRRID